MPNPSSIAMADDWATPDAPRLIALHGRKGSGKDEAFALISEIATARDESAVRHAFADKMKDLAMFVLRLPRDREPDFKNHGVVDSVADTRTHDHASHITGRQFEQDFGNGAREILGSNIWLDQVLPLGGGEVPLWPLKFGSQEARAHYAVITDLRLVAEAHRVLDLGGEVWHIDADERLGENTDGNITEAPLPPEYITLTIDNNGNLDALRKNVTAVLGVKS